MGKFSDLAIFVLVGIVHFFLLKNFLVQEQIATPTPDAKVHHITLSSVQIQQPQPIVEPPKPEPLPEPIVEPIIEPKPQPKPKPIKPTPKPKIVEPQPQIVQEVIERPIIQPVSQPIIAQAAPMQSVDTSSIRDRYTAHIRSEIRKNLFYPPIAKRMRMEGEVDVAFRVTKNGNVTQVQVVNSPKKQLSDGALKTLEMIALKPIPSELDVEYLDIAIPIEFILKEG